MTDDGRVVRLVEAANGQPAPSLSDWLQTWASEEALEGARSVVLVVERSSGAVECVAQSTARMDGFRLIGVLQALIHRLTVGRGMGFTR